MEEEVDELRRQHVAAASAAMGGATPLTGKLQFQREGSEQTLRHSGLGNPAIVDRADLRALEDRVNRKVEEAADEIRTGQKRYVRKQRELQERVTALEDRSGAIGATRVPSTEKSAARKKKADEKRTKAKDSGVNLHRVKQDKGRHEHSPMPWGNNALESADRPSRDLELRKSVTPQKGILNASATGGRGSISKSPRISFDEDNIRKTSREREDFDLHLSREARVLKESLDEAVRKSQERLPKPPERAEMPLKPLYSALGAERQYSTTQVEEHDTMGSTLDRKRGES